MTRAARPVCLACFLFLLAVPLAPSRAQGQIAASDPQATVERLDRELFDAYNTCDLETFGAMLAVARGDRGARLCFHHLQLSAQFVPVANAGRAVGVTLFLRARRDQ